MYEIENHKLDRVAGGTLCWAQASRLICPDPWPRRKLPPLKPAPIEPPVICPPRPPIDTHVF
ncbi:hypothetical protein [Cognatiyoonia sp. IB215182]|uniref:hypothetical protein n=1 Tax=Cognatiyoonia sp. IB215182 TaxID=3097353 RepID=UPI002A140E9E|nr:hypothetical protein [Cognatiyoonia sp. IB215182]MDX8355018.1 hypothetical protein [Cognatiyoonia sp. IB215182]